MPKHHKPTTQEWFNLIQEQLASQKRQLNRIERKIGRSYQGIMEQVDQIGEEVMQEIDDLNAAMEENTTVEKGLATLADKIFVMLQANLPNSAQNAELKAAIKKTTDAFKAQTAETAAAILRNTPNENPGGSVGGNTEPTPT